MKLYATVSSERASKGQGGRELEIEVLNEYRVPVANIRFQLIDDGKRGYIRYGAYFDSNMERVAPEKIKVKEGKKPLTEKQVEAYYDQKEFEREQWAKETKGKKQKGEEGVCQHRIRTYNCPICNPAL